MTAAEAIGRLARRRLEKADRALRASRNLLQDGLYEDSTSRSYHAMFHAVSALLLTKGLSTSRHKGAISLFDLHFIKPRVLDPELSIWIHDAFKARQEADYGEEALDPRAAAEQPWCMPKPCSSGSARCWPNCSRSYPGEGRPIREPDAAATLEVGEAAGITPQGSRDSAAARSGRMRRSRRRAR
jgi:hypothetical protein